MRQRAVRQSAALGALCLALLLAGCTAGEAPEGSPSSASPMPEKTLSASPSPSVTIEPVLVVASVDVDGDHVSASGYVQGVIQDTGTCTFVFTRDGSPDVTVDHEAVADRATTSCGTVQPEIARFARGTWQVALTFTSGGREYTSQPQTLEVP